VITCAHLGKGLAVSVSAYRVVRDNQQCHESIQKFIRAKAKASDEGKLCQVLQRYADKVAPGQSSTDDIWSGFPWLTIVLGTGALELPDADAIADLLAAEVKDQVENFAKGADYLNWQEPDNGGASETAQTLAQEFTQQLAVGRLGSAPGPRNRSAKAPRTLPDNEIRGAAAHDDIRPVDEFSAKLVLLTAVLTRFYYTVQVSLVPPIARWDSDVAALSHKSQPLFRQDARERANEAEQLIESLRNDIRDKTSTPVDSSVTHAVDELLEDMHSDLRRGPTLALRRLRFLTEVAWYFVSHGRPIYAGWTDLLLFLTLQQGPRASSNRGPAPRFPNLTVLPDMVERLHEAPTKASKGLDGARLNKLEYDSAKKRYRLYEAAANVLWAQAEATRTERDDLRKEGKRPPLNFALPPAAGFVSSFDIELDMAMWSTADGRPFRVILPVHLVQRSNSSYAELCWLMGELHPRTDHSDDEAGLENLRSPTNWRLVTNLTDESELRETPIIVHLNGSPLYRIPKLNSPEAALLVEELAAVGLDVVLGSDRLEHAVTIDEYLALRQSETELIWHGFEESETRKHLNRNLPKQLMTSTRRNPRYWLSLGVPVSDAGVRHRLVSQLTRERLSIASESLRPDDAGLVTGQGGAVDSGSGFDIGSRSSVSTDDSSGADTPKMGGAAINLRTGDDAASLLYWAGLDLVSGDCNDLVGELHHYAAHVGAPPDDKKPDPSSICKLEPAPSEFCNPA
jgi:hypothetical protein